MDWATICEAIRIAVLDAGGLADGSVSWSGSGTTGWGPPPQVELSITTNTSHGTDEVRKTYDPDTDTRSIVVVGNRRLAVRVGVETQDQTPGARAGDVAEKIRTGLRRPSIRDVLQAAGVSHAGARTIVKADFTSDLPDRCVISAAVLELILLAAALETDTVDTGNWVESVKVSTVPDLVPGGHVEFTVPS